MHDMHILAVLALTFAGIVIGGMCGLAYLRGQWATTGSEECAETRDLAQDATTPSGLSNQSVAG
jgi:hypothetical protein